MSSTFTSCTILLNIFACVILAWHGVDLTLSALNNINKPNYLKHLALGTFYIAFGLLSFILELLYPPRLATYMGFYSRWLGKALWFLFLGALMVSPPRANIPCQLNCWGGLYLIILAALYILCYFLPAVPPPTPANQSYQVYTKSTASSSVSTAGPKNGASTTSASRGGGTGAPDLFCPSCGTRKETKTDAFCGNCGGKL